MSHNADAVATESTTGRAETPPSSRVRQTAGDGQTVGSVLRQQRLLKRMGMAEVARITRIPLATLEAIEADHFDDLPGEVFVRGFLKAFARAVGLVPADVLARYTASRRSAVVTPIPTSFQVPAQREGRGRRFGVAIAFVLLLILFTLALSIVLKPRGRDMPQELSHEPVPTFLRTV